MEKKSSSRIWAAIITGFFGVIAACIAIAPWLFEILGWEVTSPSSLVLKVGTEKTIYRHGDALRLKVYASDSCYLHLFVRQPNGIIVRIFPNEYRPDACITGNCTHTIPSAQGEFDFLVNCNEGSGTEEIIAYASTIGLPSVTGIKHAYGMLQVDVEQLHRYEQDNIAASRCVIVASKN